MTASKKINIRAHIFKDLTMCERMPCASSARWQCIMNTGTIAQTGEKATEISHLSALAEQDERYYNVSCAKTAETPQKRQEEQS